MRAYRRKLIAEGEIRRETLASSKMGNLSCLALSSRLQDEVRDRIGARYQGKVARPYLDGFSIHAFGHEALQIRIDGPVFRGHGIPARLRPPCRVRCPVGQQ